MQPFSVGTGSQARRNRKRRDCDLLWIYQAVGWPGNWLVEWILLSHQLLRVDPVAAHRCRVAERWGIETLEHL